MPVGHTSFNFYFWIWVSIFSYKAPTRGHYDRTWALGVANMRVCFMNGSMIEHDGLGITYFRVDILKDMVSWWYAWLLMSSCQIIDYYFESFKSKCPCYKRKEYMMNMIGSIPQQKFCFQLLFTMMSFMRKSCCLSCYEKWLKLSLIKLMHYASIHTS